MTSCDKRQAGRWLVHNSIMDQRKSQKLSVTRDMLSKGHLHMEEQQTNDLLATVLIEMTFDNHKIRPRNPSLEKRNKNPDSKKYKYKTKIYKRKGILQLRKWKIKVIRPSENIELLN